jgi:VWFA-related protein
MPTAIRDFYVGESPISLALLLDISGSMAVGGNMDRAREAVNVATMNLRDAGDEAALFTFDSKLVQVVDFTTDLSRIRRVSLKGNPWGQTSLYDAIGQAARAVGERTSKHRALLVITDGVDTNSRLTPGEVSAIASEIDVPVYLLTVVNPADHPGGEFAVLETEGKRTETATLADLARWTGGDMRIASVPAHTVEALQDLFNELRHQYLITFEPGMRPGWHPLEIRTRKKNLIVHARSGYMSGPSR